MGPLGTLGRAEPMDITNPLRRLSRPRFPFLVLATIAMILAGRGSGWPTLQAQPPTNPIVLENQLTGTPQSEWDVSGSGDPNIQGYATDISVNKGGLVTFKIKLQPAVTGGYVIDIYRLGYYQGMGARFVSTAVPTAQQIIDSKNQPACLRDDSAGLVDCGNWSVSGTFDTTGLTSGVYIARPRRTDTGGASHIVFIVRDDARKADVLFQTSDTTWQAYNQYPGLADGGSSLYCNGPLDNSAGDYSCATRSAKVSYNRPFDTRDHDKSSWLFNAEYPMLRWLEANGYDTKYWAGVDTDRLGANPTIGLASAVGPKTYELWSQRMNAEVAKGHLGAKLAFTRLTFNYFISDAVFDYIVDAVHLIAREGWKLLALYRFDPESGLWQHRAAMPDPPVSLGDLTAAIDGTPTRFATAPESVLAGQLEAAREIIATVEARPPAGPLLDPELSEEFEQIRWFPLPGEGLEQLLSPPERPVPLHR